MSCTLLAIVGIKLIIAGGFTLSIPSFAKHANKNVEQDEENEDQDKEQQTQNVFNRSYGFGQRADNRGRYAIKNAYKSAEETINIDNIRSARLENKFGTLKIHFEDTILMQEQISVRASNSFGSIKMYMPKS